MADVLTAYYNIDSSKASPTRITASLNGTGSWAASASLAVTAKTSFTATQSIWATQSAFATASIWATSAVFSSQSLWATQSTYATNSTNVYLQPAGLNGGYSIWFSTAATGYKSALYYPQFRYDPNDQSLTATSSWSTNVVNGSTFNGTSSLYGTASWASSLYGNKCVVTASQPDVVVDWGGNSGSYGRIVFRQDGLERAAFQMLGSGFDQTYLTNGRSNAMEFYNQDGNVIFFVGGAKRVTFTSASVLATVPTEMVSTKVDPGPAYTGVILGALSASAGAVSRLIIEGSQNQGILFRDNNKNTDFGFASFRGSPTATASFTIWNEKLGQNSIYVEGSTNKVVIGNNLSPVNALDVIGNISASVITASLFSGSWSGASNKAEVNNPTVYGYLSLNDIGVGNPTLGFGKGGTTLDISSTTGEDLYITNEFWASPITINGGVITASFFNGSSSYSITSSYTVPTYFSSSLLSAVVLATLGTHYNGPAIGVLSAGVWMIGGFLSIARPAGGGTGSFTMYLQNGNIVYASAEGSNATQTNTLPRVNLGCTAIVTVPANSSITASCSVRNAFGWYLEPTASLVSATSGSNACQVWAYKIG